MKKTAKMILLILGILILVVVVDTSQALVFDNSPFFKIREYYNGGDLNYRDKGLFVDTWCGTNGNKDTVIKGFSYSISDDTYDDINKANKKQLTLDKIVELSSKGNNLTWSDFEQYESIETGSGLYILVYEIDETFDLWIGGTSTEESPLYIRLLTKSSTNNYIDIRTEDVNKFIKSNKQ